MYEREGGSEREGERERDFLIKKKNQQPITERNSAKSILGPFKTLDTNTKQQTHPVKKAYTTVHRKLPSHW